MKKAYFAEFYNRDRHGELVGALGSNSVVYLDGRCSLATQHSHAYGICKRRGYAGYRLCVGTFSNPHYRTATIVVDKVGESNTV